MKTDVVKCCAANTCEAMPQTFALHAPMPYAIWHMIVHDVMLKLIDNWNKKYKNFLERNGL